MKDFNEEQDKLVSMLAHHFFVCHVLIDLSRSVSVTTHSRFRKVESDKKYALGKRQHNDFI